LGKDASKYRSLFAATAAVLSLLALYNGCFFFEGKWQELCLSIKVEKRKFCTKKPPEEEKRLQV